MKNSGTIFHTERLFVRPYTEADLDDFFRLNGDEEIMRYIRPAQDFEQSKAFLRQIIIDYTFRPGIGRWALYSTDGPHFVGSFAIIPVEGSSLLQLGYALTRENWGKGYASESVRGGLVYAREHLRLSSIAGITYPDNTASQHVLLKNGFVFDSEFLEDGKKMHQYIYRFISSGQFA
jgi:ribosomal-protein-alanine N-acetyltransferase